MSEEVKVVKLSIPSSWIPKIEEYMKKNGFRTKNELIRHLIREHVLR